MLLFSRDCTIDKVFDHPYFNESTVAPLISVQIIYKTEGTDLKFIDDDGSINLAKFEEVVLTPYK